MFQKAKAFFAPFSATGPVEFIVVGLGNPGPKYQDTRHNAGFIALEAIAAAENVTLTKLRFQSSCGECVIDGHRVLLLRPSTFMNRSGEAVRDAMAFYKIPPERCIVLYDDITLPPGRLRIRKKGSDGGHNGMKSIIYLTGSDAFPRVRLGIGERPHPDYQLADWVLGRFTPGERKEIDTAAGDALSAVTLILGGQMDAAMNRYNGGSPNSK